MEDKGARRYCLILLTTQGTGYYYDLDLGTFVMMHPKDKPYRTTLHAIDYLTANFDSIEQLAGTYGINEPIYSLYISYNQNGEKLLAPVFNNPKWANLAKSYTETKNRKLSNESGNHNVEIDFRIPSNNEMFQDVYFELSNIDENGESKFANYILDKLKVSKKNDKEKKTNNRKELLVSTINDLVKNEKELLKKEQTAFGITPHKSSSNNFDRIINRDSIYVVERHEIYEEMKKYLSNYRLFRTMYLYYCKYISSLPKKENVEEKKDKPKKLVKEPIRPPMQMSMFNERGNLICQNK